MPPVVALLSDFGTADHYVGAMKGAVLAACPDARLVDVTHELPAHDVRAAAFVLASAANAFPAEAVFLAVVDPGVGGPRRGVALRAGAHFFVGPDNGLFTLVLQRASQVTCHELTNAGLFRHRVAPTFHGRDVFAPVAGRLAQGMPLSEVGPAVEDPVVFEIDAPRSVGAAAWEAPVVHVDRFGNLVTAFTVQHLDAILSETGGDATDVVVVVEGLVMPLVRTYSDIAEGEACALLGSDGRLEVAVNRGNASRTLGAAVGAPVRVRRA